MFFGFLIWESGIGIRDSGFVNSGFGIRDSGIEIRDSLIWFGRSPCLPVSLSFSLFVFLSFSLFLLFSLSPCLLVSFSPGLAQTYLWVV